MKDIFTPEAIKNANQSQTGLPQITRKQFVYGASIMLLGGFVAGPSNFKKVPAIFSFGYGQGNYGTHDEKTTIY